MQDKKASSSTLTSLVLLSIRNHWLSLTLWISIQILLGYFLTHEGKIQWGDATLLDAREHLGIEDVYYYHELGGKWFLSTLILLYILCIPFYMLDGQFDLLLR